ncbi:protein SPA1-RELATED 4-like isoform X1 [Vicia villosa]|uniref:protein SPA1-RELATED 4-like isoform X1 n=1 Tax=Vicia villosa TaxID=3911 RepID=UPI00273B4114|nr:protein SPA1-RELATED 4-like isoform X1 [Vicia villosa]XP_058754840.1 protein SPA1-RELATED 4-like isoform X1 [Vicia villosa]XP_058754841.1 protein SPA1-RELATED 4-like isoform X1 [Vicia villosa]
MEDNSESSRALNSSGVSDRNQRQNPFSGEGSEDSRFRKERDWIHGGLQLDLNKNLGGFCEDEVENDRFFSSVEWDDISLRQWLDKPDRSVDFFECLHVFRQIVEIVNAAHCQGVVVHNVRPSCFVMSSFNHISFIESASCSDTGSDSLGDGMNGEQGGEAKTPTSHCPRDMMHPQSLGGEDFLPAKNSMAARSDSSCMLSSAVYAARASLIEETEENKMKDRRKDEEVEVKKQSFPMKQILQMEMTWYTSPEEVSGTPSSCASDVYRLGILLFELFCPLSSREEKSRTMSSLRHRVLPPQLLLKWPKEASFCLWLLHPDPSSRPTLGELLQSEFLNEQRDDMEEREAAIEIRQKIEDQELLHEFLSLLKQRKQEVAEKLQHTIAFLCSDIEEVAKKQTRFKEISGVELGSDERSASTFPSMTVIDSEDSACLGTRKRVRLGVHVDESDDNTGNDQKSSGSFLSKSSRLMKNFKKLESAYFLTRCKPTYSSGRQAVRHSSIANDGRGSVVINERSSINSLAMKEKGRDGASGWINPFLEGLCKYLSFSKVKVKADLKQGDLLHSSNLVCSLSFDRDGEFFATAGVNKKIKIFECDTIINEDRDIHYPVVEMACRSKLSSLCWNTYIKSQIASSNFEGVVQLWDVTRSQVLSEMREHERRVWSIDFSSADPTMLASGSDDGCVKLWSINQGVSIGTIKTKANVCCVQFPLDSARYLAFGSADHRIYYYDLRNLRAPLCTLVGHNKTVSYIKFVDNVNLVSASTDNTLKLWDLSTCTSRVIDSPIQSFTGHTNVKNFVGLSVSDGYIATGSETNEVFIYHKAFPMPALQFKFQNTDPISGHEVDDAAQFVSSVCWRGQSPTLIAANSTGNVKILEMV